ncbi:MAG: TlpA family protein disulfide reductase [Pseudomonadales bacterium]
MKRQHQPRTCAQCSSWLLLALIALLAGCADQNNDSAEKWVFVNYWAIWCGPCREEIPELNLFAEQFPDKLAVFGVNFDGVTGAQLAEQIETLGIRFANPEHLPKHLPAFPVPETLPTTYVIHNGKLAQTLVGPQNLASLTAAMSERATQQTDKL